MSTSRHVFGAVGGFVHRHFLWLLIGSYAAAALWPASGLWMKSVTLGEVPLPGGVMKLTLPMAMLALLLVNAGLGVQTTRLRALLGIVPLVGTGLAANLLIPIAFIFGVSQALRPWHEPDEAQNLLVGLALVASMPIAGSSTAWSQNNDGDTALSLGLVLLSTLLSPLTTPAALHTVGFLATGASAQDLHRVAGWGAGAFLAVCVLGPSLLGVFGRVAVGGARADAFKPYLKLANALNLLLLNYANGAVSLPQAVANPDWDFLAVTLGLALALCVTAFAGGWLLARLWRAPPAQRTALMFGLGMNNNGTGLVLASVALAGQPRVMLPVIFYNLTQHLVAGAVALFLNRGAAAGQPGPINAAQQEPGTLRPRCAAAPSPGPLA